MDRFLQHGPLLVQGHMLSLTILQGNLALLLLLGCPSALEHCMVGVPLWGQWSSQVIPCRWLLGSHCAGAGWESPPSWAGAERRRWPAVVLRWAAISPSPHHCLTLLPQNIWTLNQRCFPLGPLPVGSPEPLSPLFSYVYLPTLAQGNQLLPLGGDEEGTLSSLNDPRHFPQRHSL